jgi:hypothetical protein
MNTQTDSPSTEDELEDAKTQGQKTPAEQAVINQEEDLESGKENPV